MNPSVPTTWRAPARAGYDPSAARTRERVVPMLEGEPVVWLSTVRPDGTPHLVPTWFWWDGEALLVWSKPDAVKVRNLRANPRLMVALGRPEEDFAVALIEARAIVETRAAAIPETFFIKYAGELAGAGLDPDAFRSTYTQAIRIVPLRLLPWRGRGARHDARHDPLPVGTDGVARNRAASGAPGAPQHPGSILPAWA